MSDDPRGPYKRRVVCAANLYKVNGKNVIILGARHFDTLMHISLAAYKLNTSEYKGTDEQGFIDQHGVFMDRNEAYHVAKNAGQFIGLEYTKETLYSENLY